MPKYINGGLNEPSGFYFSDEEEDALRAEAIEILKEDGEGDEENELVIDMIIDKLKDAIINEL